MYLANSLPYLAKSELIEASKLEPYRADTYAKLADVYSTLGRGEDADRSLREAIDFAPFDPHIHAQLGLELAKRGNIQQARSELNLAEYYGQHSDCGLFFTLGLGYASIFDYPNASLDFERFLTGAKDVGLDGPAIDQATRALREVNLRTQARYFPISSNLLDRLRNGITRCKQLCATNTELLASTFPTTPELDKWCAGLLQENRTPLAKAMALFEHLATAAEYKGKGPALGTYDGLEGTSAHQEGLSCDQYTRLYIALARQLGVEAYYVFVTKDYYGNPTSHACAAVVINNQALLVDPMYEWFGIPHQEYDILQDSRVVAIYLAKSPSLVDQERARVLAANWGVLHIWLSISRALRSDLGGAEECFAIAKRLGAPEWMELYAQGLIELQEQQWVKAQEDFEKCLQRNPNAYRARFLLATAFQARGDVRHAAQEFAEYLKAPTDPGLANRAAEALRAIRQAGVIEGQN